jgi:hypothetical protein
MDPFIKKLRTAKKQTVSRKKFRPRQRLSLTYVRGKEPNGWPLTRPATRVEWAHVLRVMIMRRIPRGGPIHHTKLIRYVSADVQAASDAGKIYVEADFEEMRMAYSELKRMVAAQIVRMAPRMQDPEMPGWAPAVYRTENAERWLNLVPAVIKAVVDFLPTTSVLDLMVQSLVDADVEPDQTPPSQPPPSL